MKREGKGKFSISSEQFLSPCILALAPARCIRDIIDILFVFTPHWLWYPSLRYTPTLRLYNTAHEPRVFFLCTHLYILEHIRGLTHTYARQRPTHARRFVHKYIHTTPGMYAKDMRSKRPHVTRQSSGGFSARKRRRVSSLRRSTEEGLL